MKTNLALLSLGTLLAFSNAQQPDPFKEFPEKYWDFSLVERVPEYREAPEEFQVKGLKAILVEGFGPKADDTDFSQPFPKPLKEKTKAEFFAYIGFPSTPMPKGGYPGIVLIHGGGGTAFPGWTKIGIIRCLFRNINIFQQTALRSGVPCPAENGRIIFPISPIWRLLILF